jgi:hypothetical protein
MATYNPLQSVELTASAANVTFSNIDQGYTDLVLVFSGQVTSAVSLALQVNGDTATSYSVTELAGDGSTATSSRSSNAASMTISSVGAQIGTGTPWVSTLHFQSYSNTTTNKPVLMRTSAPGTITTLNAGMYRSTAAITSIRLMGFANASGFAAGTTFDLYGIKSGAPQALGGDTVTTDGNYWYHTFRSTGAFIPQKTLSVEYLVVGAGGAGAPGGSSSSGAGAGGGGSSSSTFTSTSNASYTVTVGGGGTGPGIAGSSSTISGSNISTITAGGGNAERENRVGGLGGTGTSGTGGTGGNGVIGSSSGNGTNGAAGNTFSISGTSTTYGGGGGGAGRGGGSHGTGGAGGGGNGGAPGTAGTANTGGGGGGTTTDNTNGGNGGSGIVIVRYPV